MLYAFGLRRRPGLAAVPALDGRCIHQLGDSPGWQREIALWNVGLIAAIVAALLKRSEGLLRLMTLQSAVLCLCLGCNHLLALVQDFSWEHGIHLLGVLEVLLLGGVWGTVLLIRGRDKR